MLKKQLQTPNAHTQQSIGTGAKIFTRLGKLTRQTIVGTGIVFIKFKSIVELMVLLRHIKRKFVRVHDKDHLGQVSVVTFADGKVELIARGQTGLDQLLCQFRLGTPWDAY